MKRAIVFSAILLALPVVAQPDGIVVVGVDQLGHSFSRTVPTSEYFEKFQTTFEALNPTVLSALREASERSSERPASSREAPVRQWRLRSVAVGIGVETEIGIGPILTLGAQSRFRLLYSNSTHPTFPD